MVDAFSSSAPLQRLQMARRELALESAIAKLDRYAADHGQSAIRRMGGVSSQIKQ
jgi:hypothetical protein